MLIFKGAESAVAGQDQPTYVYIKVEATNSQSGELIATLVQSGQGLTLASKDVCPTLDSVKTLLNVWVEHAVLGLTKRLQN